MMEELFFDAKGIKINYAKGPNNGPALLLIPGQSTTWQNYEPVFAQLCKNFEVFALSIRGHGKSSWTSGAYTFNNIGGDITLFLQDIVGRPAIIAGNSSGGLIALWLAVNHKELVKGIVLEDAPLFSADWPRIKQEFVYEVLSKTAHYLGAPKGADYEGFFNSIKRPLANGITKSLPKSLSKMLAWLIKNREGRFAKFLLVFMPKQLKSLIQTIPTFDPDFSRSWVDGRIYTGLDHEVALKKIDIPLVIIHANWFRTNKGLVGAMDDEDAQKARLLAPHAEYIRVNSEHVTHSDNPDEYVNIINEFNKKI